MNSVALLGGLVYLISILMFFSSSSILLLWLCMEVNLVSFLFIMYILSGWYNKDNFSLSLYYLLTQSVGSFLFLYSVLINSGTIWSASSFILLTAMTLKLGLFPFHFWLFKMGNLVGPAGFLMLMTFQKIPYISFVIHLNSPEVLMFVMLSGLSGAFLILSSTNMEQLLISSSIYMMFWIYTISLQSIHIFLILFSFYFLSIYIFSTNLYSDMFVGAHAPMFFYVLFLFLLGLPPLNMFFFKFVGVHSITYMYNLSLFLFLSAITFVSLVGYIRFMYRYLFFSLLPNPHWKNQLTLKMMSFFQGLVWFWFFFSCKGKLYKLSGSYLE